MEAAARKKVDVSAYRSDISPGNRLGRLLWSLVHALLFRPSPVVFFGWRIFLLRLFGARIGKGVHIYPSCRIWAPWNLEMGDHSCMSHFVDCYSVGKVAVGAHATVSQYAYICTATHDITDPGMRLQVRPVHIGEGAWVCAKAYVGPGVTMAEGSVAAAGSVVAKDVGAWDVVGGNPAVFIKKRVLD